MKFPENLLYTKDHEWIKVEGDMATIGISEFAQGELGDIVYIEVETEGETLEKGESFGTIEAVKTVADIYMPVGGEVLEFNSELEAHPEFVNTDSYGSGWIIKIRITNPAELDSLMKSDVYTATTSH
ncbi:MAG: glycine cleavage system protein GcvH [Bacteroidota bacterium]